MKRQIISTWIIAACLTAIAFFNVTVTTAHAGSTSSAVAPEEVLQQYLKAVYSRDASTAYMLTSAVDQQVKSLEHYSDEVAAFDGRSLLLARALSDGVKFSNTKTEIKGVRATVVFDVQLPNANDALIDEIVHSFDRDRLSRLSSEQITTLASDVSRKAESGELPVLKASGETWKLVQEDGTWRVFQNWAQAVEVTFAAYTFHDLGWEFTPVREIIMAKHGETINMSYRARNIGSDETTGKARHVVGPSKQAKHLESIECFCFLEQTLAPGEEVELPLVFRVNYEAPDAVRKFDVKYEFYPFHKFPANHAADVPAVGEKG